MADEKNNKIMEALEYFKIMEALKTKQMILQGPPGTSKTYMAKKIVARKLAEVANTPYWGEENCKSKTVENETLTNEKDWIKAFLAGKLKGVKDVSKKWEMVQFHPSYGYEDFVRGITVKTSEGGQISYETVNKVFGDMCNRAKGEGLYFLIIDEINRADVATVFGELLYGLEYRNEEITIPYEVGSEKKLIIPDNLYVIGTMNTADKSVGNIDYAIRRRFVFFDCPASEKILQDYYKNKDNSESIPLFKAVQKFLKDSLHPDYRLADFQIGHTYFMAKNTDEQKNKFQYQILPILREYYIDGILRRSGIGNENNALYQYLSGQKSLDEETAKAIEEDLRSELKQG